MPALLHHGVDAAEGVDAGVHELLGQGVVGHRPDDLDRAALRQRSPPQRRAAATSFVPFTARPPRLRRPGGQAAAEPAMLGDDDALAVNYTTTGERRGTRTRAAVPSPRGHRDDRRSPAPGLGRWHDRAAAVRRSRVSTSPVPTTCCTWITERQQAPTRMDADGLEDRLHKTARSGHATTCGGPMWAPVWDRTLHRASDGARGARRHVRSCSPVSRPRSSSVPSATPTRDETTPAPCSSAPHRCRIGGVRDRAVPLRELAGVRGSRTARLSSVSMARLSCGDPVMLDEHRARDRLVDELTRANVTLRRGNDVVDTGVSSVVLDSPACTLAHLLALPRRSGQDRAAREARRRRRDHDRHDHGHVARRGRRDVDVRLRRARHRGAHPHDFELDVSSCGAAGTSPPDPLLRLGTTSWVRGCHGAGEPRGCDSGRSSESCAAPPAVSRSTRRSVHRGRGADARGCVHVHPDVVRIGDGRLTAVDPDADPDRHVVGP